MTTGPLSMGLPEPLKTRPGGGQGCWKMLRASPGSLTAAHPPHHYQLPPAPRIPNAPCPLPPHPSVTSRELATVTFSLGVSLPPLETFIGKVFAQDNYSNWVIWGLKRGEGQVWQILGGN